eukprot:CAMPEP_0168627150 /NCGR_PEP_ID=MMETSP0449_2-20121227/11060_1 /TAXON_ID=1082188 /ORGANISM="Strombidium rassoulzadegani, Strain ras09" /LENGTH=31 /DNA_ID= /DNA_START= /DNA_END= /DNA_ORIENTATION=
MTIAMAFLGLISSQVIEKPDLFEEESNMSDK